MDFGIVIPAQAEIQCPIADFRLRGNDKHPGLSPAIAPEARNH
jgi:hypothetical protein